MRFREPLLGGSSAMPGASLQRACRLLVAVCALHLGITLVYYLAGSDLGRLPQLVGVRTPLQGGPTVAATLEPRSRGAPPPLSWGVSSELRPGSHSSPRPASNLTSAPVLPTSAPALPACPEESPLLVGPMPIDFNIKVDLKLVEKQNPNVKLGGRYSPKDCISPHKVAIVIPFRNRQEHLKYWLYYLHPILQRQQLDYGIYVINQQNKLKEELLSVICFLLSTYLLFCTLHLKTEREEADLTTAETAAAAANHRCHPGNVHIPQFKPRAQTLLVGGSHVNKPAGEFMFNRAKLLNIGFQEALKDYDYNCFVFSDVDLIPMDDRNTYRCFQQPRHISVAMDKFGFNLPYVQYFGGVSALSKQQFLTINGFPNNYWGWGGEDDDIFNRLVFKGMSLSRPNAIIGRCRMIRHTRDKKNEPNPQRFDRIAHTKETMFSDGLNSLTYSVLDIQRYPLYTKITVDIGSPS